jgi:hypothetical protein
VGRRHLHQIAADNRDQHQRDDIHTPSLVLIRPDGHIGYRSALDALSDYACHLDEFYTRAAEA